MTLRSVASVTSLERLEIALRRIGDDTDGVKLDRADELAVITFRDPDNF
jgi:hypothetical protein